MGFNLPIREWANETICNAVKENFNQFNEDTNWFNESIVFKQLDLLKNGNNQYTNNIWTMYFLINWYKKWF